MGYFRSKLVDDLCVDDIMRPTRIRRASQGPQGRVVPFRGCKAKPDRRLRLYVLQSAAPTGPSPWFHRGVSSLPYTVHLCLGECVEGSSIAVLCSVASRV